MCCPSSRSSERHRRTGLSQAIDQCRQSLSLTSHRNQPLDMGQPTSSQHQQQLQQKTTKKEKFNLKATVLCHHTQLLPLPRPGLDEASSTRIATQSLFFFLVPFHVASLLRLCGCWKLTGLLFLSCITQPSRVHELCRMLSSPCRPAVVDWGGEEGRGSHVYLLSLSNMYSCV